MLTEVFEARSCEWKRMLIAVNCEKADNWLPRNEIEIGNGI